MTWQTTYWIPWEEAGLMEAFEANQNVRRTIEDTIGRVYQSAVQTAKIESESITEDAGKEEEPYWEAETTYYGDGQHSYTLYRCPVCHARYMSPTDYCPHCGKPLNRTEGRDGD